MGRWEFVGGGSAKFWEAAVEDGTVTMRYGRVGSEDRTQQKELHSAEAARQYLAKAIAEKERKGYREVTAGAEAVDAAEQSQAEERQTTFPDEDTFVIPAAWRRLVYPRRGGIKRNVGELRPDAEELVERRLKEEAHWVEQMLSAPKSDPRIVEATRAHLSGSHTPLGAAALARVTMHYQLPDGVFVDAWIRAHGMAFAARAVVEFFGIEAHWMQYGGLREDPWIAFRPGTGAVDSYGSRTKFADRLRSLLAVADEDAYRQAVAALAHCRDGARRRIVVSYLAPGEQDWVAECCADAVMVDGTLQAMLLCSLNSPEQLDHFDRRLDLDWHDWSLPLVSTLAEGTGKTFAPVLDEALDQAAVGVRLDVQRCVRVKVQSCCGVSRAVGEGEEDARAGFVITAAEGGSRDGVGGRALA